MSKVAGQVETANKRIIPNWGELDKYKEVYNLSDRKFAAELCISWTLYWNLRKFKGLDLPVPNKMIIAAMELTGWPFEKVFLIASNSHS